MTSLLANYLQIRRATCPTLKGMEITFKIVLDKRRVKRNQTYPLKARVYQGQTHKTYSLGIDLRDADWNDQLQEVKKCNSNHRLYNLKINTLKSKVQKSIFLNEGEENVLSPTLIIDELKGKKQVKSVTEKPDILTYGRSHIEKLEISGCIGNANVYKCAVNKLASYGKTSTLTFEQVNYTFIENFNACLLAEGMKVNGISNYMRTIRALFNKAIKEGIISADCYPFSKFKIKNERTINRTLTVVEIASIATLKLEEGSTICKYRDLFMLSYCLIGINFADLLTLTRENIVDGRIVFRRRKTHKVYSIHLHPQALKLLNKYLVEGTDRTKDFLLPYVVNKNNPANLKKDILQVIKNTNDYLIKIAKECQIEKPITTYYARYTWANVARSLGYSKDIIAEGLGHEYGNKVTGIYLDNYSNALIDEMNARIMYSTYDAPDKNIYE